MNLDTKVLIEKLKPIMASIKKHRVVIGIILVLSIYGWLVLQINLLNNIEPTEDAVTEKLRTVKRPVINKQIVDKMQQLQDENIEVQTLFKQARENPFQE